MSNFLDVTLEDAAANQKALQFFDLNTSSFSRSRSSSQQRSSFSPAFKAFGDNHPDRAILTLSGPVFADSIEGYEVAWRQVIAFAMVTKWVKTQAYQFEVLRLQLDSQARNNQIKSDDVRTLTLTFLLKHPYKASLADTVINQAVVAGTNIIAASNDGDVYAHPVVELTGSSITDLVLSIADRTLSLPGIALGTNTLTIDTLNGTADINGADQLPIVPDTSQFPRIKTGGDDIFLTLTGGAGSLVTRYKEFYW